MCTPLCFRVKFHLPIQARKHPSQMQYEHYLYLYRLSTRLRKRNASILLETIVNAAEVTSAVLLTRNFGPCPVTTSGPMVLPTRTRNIMFCSYEPPYHKRQNVSIFSTHDDNRWHVTTPLLDLISHYMSFSYVTRPLPVKWHFRSKQEISYCVRMAFPCYNQKTECFYLVYKRR
jgi:hypothetical protein